VGQTRLWGFHTAALPAVFRLGDFLSQALAPLQSFTHASPRSARDSRRFHSHTPLPRFLPLQRLQPRGATYPAGSHPAGFVAPSGFLTLSTPCSPHGLPGLFHPSTAHGVFNTLRGFDPHTVPYTLSSAAPLGVSGQKRIIGPAPPGTHTPYEARHQAWVLRQDPLPNAPLGFPAPGFLALNSEGRSHALSSPHALFRRGRKRQRLWRPRVFSAENAAVLF
jgi:hypothetical protein